MKDQIYLSSIDGQSQYEARGLQAADYADGTIGITTVYWDGKNTGQVTLQLSPESALTLAAKLTNLVAHNLGRKA